MKNKKILAVSALFLLTTLSGCGGGETPSSNYSESSVEMPVSEVVSSSEELKNNYLFGRRLNCKNIFFITIHWRMGSIFGFVFR